MTKIKNIESYKAGFLNGIDAKDNHKFSILGYGIEKLLDIIGEYEMTNDKPKVKMTRAEAIDSLQKHCPVDDPAAIIDFYIEAGMLEVMEELSPREKFRQALADAGHSEATVYGHWALYAYDVAHPEDGLKPELNKDTN